MGKDTIYLLVVGSKTFDDYEMMKTVLKKAHIGYEHVVIVSGGEKGADSLAEQYAKDNGYGLVKILADWNKYNKQAGYIRNKEMHEFIATKENRGCVAFWDGLSRGTKQNFDLAKQYNNPLHIELFHTKPD